MAKHVLNEFLKERNWCIVEVDDLDCDKYLL